jgi:hypothetical protein
MNWKLKVVDFGLLKIKKYPLFKILKNCILRKTHSERYDRGYRSDIFSVV